MNGTQDTFHRPTLLTYLRNPHLFSPLAPRAPQGKLNTEALLTQRGTNFTSIRPVYIYGPLNYNPVEEWFFQRIAAGRPVPIPGSGMQVTQLGHVKDLSDAFCKVLGNKKAAKQVRRPREGYLCHGVVLLVMLQVSCTHRFTSAARCDLI